MLSFNDIKNLLQHNRITEFVKLNRLSTRDIVEFTNRNAKWAAKLFQNLDPTHAARAFKFLRKKKQESIIKSLPEKKLRSCSTLCSQMIERLFFPCFPEMR